MAKHKRIFWQSLTGRPEDTQFVGAAMQELVAALRAKVEAFDLSIEPLPDHLHTTLLPHLEAPSIRACLDAIQDAWCQPTTPYLFSVIVYCGSEQPVARAARQRLAHAHWGLSMEGTLSLTYCEGNKHILWHETLHLLGVDDHYDTCTFETICKLPTCVMQYAPSESTVGNRPFLCSQTVAILRRSFRPDSGPRAGHLRRRGSSA